MTDSPIEVIFYLFFLPKAKGGSDEPRAIACRKKNRVMNPQEEEIVTFHESGHAIVAESVEYADPVHKFSIIPR